MLHTKEPLIFMCVQPCIPYYAWQLEVMLNNFKEIGIDKHYEVHVIGTINKRTTTWENELISVKKVESAFANDSIKFFYYEDTRDRPVRYLSSIRPNALKQHFNNNPELSNITIFYHDCDIVFTKLPDFFEKYTKGDQWYVSNTISYIGHDYILSKGQDVLDKMCEIVGISAELVKEKQLQSGGCQYIMKNVDYSFFDKMEKDSERLFGEITQLNIQKKQNDPKHHELQIWTADMWAILWGAWLKGYDTLIIPELDFCWATDVIQKWDERYIFHNAGVVGSLAETHFYKGHFRDKLPYLHEANYDKNKASYKYFEIIKSIGEKSCLL